MRPFTVTAFLLSIVFNGSLLSSEKAGIIAPGLENRELVAPLAEVIEKLSPTKDGWDTEAFNEAASEQLYRLKALIKSKDPKQSDFEKLTESGFTNAGLRPSSAKLESEEGLEFTVQRWKGGELSGESLSLFQASQQFREAFANAAPSQIATKLYKVQSASATTVVTSVLVEASGNASPTAGEGGRRQINAEWQCHWKTSEAEPLLTKIVLLRHEEVTRKHGKGQPLFSDQTRVALGNNPSFSSLLLHSTDYWRARLPRVFGLDVVANVGFLLADLNGDDLEDLYLCQQGGLPNLLFLRQSDGSFADASAGSGSDLMDYSPNALALDLDQEFELLLLRNDGSAHFERVARVPLVAQTFGISAADYDLDGDLDLFVCGYNPSAEELKESGALGSPLPFHDANNGGRNTLLQNVGSFQFRDATVESGLEKENNTRFSFAAGWEDYDLDGDPDLYVANDYGRNNLYRNDDGKFVDVAGELGVEDMSSGMSVSWEDYNRDGQSDLYVSNMFSSAGSRITFQKQFQNGDAGEALDAFQRFAKGNTLFEGASAGSNFKDVSTASGSTMGRWSWGSRFADLDNDGWLDILAANGFVSTPDTGDL